MIIDKCFFNVLQKKIQKLKKIFFQNYGQNKLFLELINLYDFAKHKRPISLMTLCHFVWLGN